METQILIQREKTHVRRRRNVISCCKRNRFDRGYGQPLLARTNTSLTSFSTCTLISSFIGVCQVHIFLQTPFDFIPSDLAQFASNSECTQGEVQLQSDLGQSALLSRDPPGEN